MSAYLKRKRRHEKKERARVRDRAQAAADRAERLNAMAGAIATSNVAERFAQAISLVQRNVTGARRGVSV